MQFLRSHTTGGTHRRTDRRPRPLVFLAVAVLATLLAVTACEQDGDSGAAPALPTPVLSVGEVEALEGRVIDMGMWQVAAWPNVELFTADYADDVTFADPTAADYRTGRDRIVGMWEGWAASTDYEVEVTGRFFSVDGAAFECDWPGLSEPPPGAEPSLTELPPPEIPSGLEVRRFEGDEVTSDRLWYAADLLHGNAIGCFAEDGCPAMQATIGDYVAAWSERDEGQVAGLYHDDAEFTDSILGLSASGDETIAGLADQRFGPTGEVTIEVLERYAWTHTYLRPTEGAPELGQPIGIALHYQASVEGLSETQEAVTTLQLCTWEDERCEPDPDGLIHREDVYHRTDSFSLWKVRQSLDDEAAR